MPHSDMKSIFLANHSPSMLYYCDSRLNYGHLPFLDSPLCRQLLVFPLTLLRTVECLGYMCGISSFGFFMSFESQYQSGNLEDYSDKLH
jgi:hypothetical protein